MGVPEATMMSGKHEAKSDAEIRKPRSLELNKETLQDLSEGESEQVRGGQMAERLTARSKNFACNNPC